MKNLIILLVFIAISGVRAAKESQSKPTELVDLNMNFKEEYVFHQNFHFFFSLNNKIIFQKTCRNRTRIKASTKL